MDQLVVTPAPPTLEEPRPAEVLVAPGERDALAPTADRAPRDRPPSRLSVSAASIFDQCPQRWKFRYIDHMPDPKGIPALVGILAHRILEDLLALPPALRTTDEARTIAGRIWPETAADADFIALGLDDDAVRAFKWETWRAVEGLWQIEDPATVDVDATEQRVETELGGVPFIGIVDRVDRAPDGLVVTDYKSGRPPRDRYLPDKLAQVLLYAAAIGEMSGSRPVRSQLHYLGATSISADVTDEAVDSAVGGLARTWDALGQAFVNDSFEPRPGPLCGWCPYADSCPTGLAEVRRRHDEGRIRASAPALVHLVA